MEEYSPPKKQPILFAGIHLSAIGFVLLMLSAIIAADHLFGPGNRFIDVVPHPFLAVIVLIAVRYGSLEGVLTAILCTLVLYVGNLPDQPPEQSMYDYQLWLVLRPMLWIISAFILGEIRLRVEREKKELQQQLKTATENIARLQNAYTKVKEAKEKQDNLLGNQHKNTTSIYLTFKYLESSSPSQILLHLDKIFGLVFAPKKFSVYALGPNGLEVATSQGWAETDTYLRRVTEDMPLYQAIAKDMRVVSQLNTQDAATLQQQGLMAAPLFDPEANKVLGMVKIEELGDSELNNHTLEAFHSLCQTVGLAYARASRRKQITGPSIFSEIPNALSPSLQEILHPYLKGLAKALNAPFVRLTFESKSALQEHEQTRLLELIEPLVKPLGLIFRSGKPNQQFEVLLLNTMQEQAETLLRDYLNLIKQSPTLRHITLQTSVTTIYEPATATSFHR